MPLRCFHWDLDFSYFRSRSKSISAKLSQFVTNSNIFLRFCCWYKRQERMIDMRLKFQLHWTTCYFHTTKLRNIELENILFQQCHHSQFISFLIRVSWPCLIVPILNPYYEIIEVISNFAINAMFNKSISGVSHGYTSDSETFRGRSTCGYTSEGGVDLGETHID